MKNRTAIFLSVVILFGCSSQNSPRIHKQDLDLAMIRQKSDEFAAFSLTASLSPLTDNERAMLPLLFKASDLIEQIYWEEAFGDKNLLFRDISDSALVNFIRINYGPWDRLNNNEPFIPAFGKKPAGANLYPSGMTREEFDAWQNPEKSSLYTLIRRDKNGKLQAVPYHQAFEGKINEIAALIKKAAALAEDPGLHLYLDKLAEAMLTDKYFESDMAWMDMKNNVIEFVAGPIETYEDQLYGYKAAHEAFILIKDKEWSSKLERFVAILPELQKKLPVEEAYKSEIPGLNSDINVYDALYYAGDCNAGSKTIAINLPNDEKVQALKGSRKLQLKNSMQAKFDKILLPISNLLIAEEQRHHVKFDAFFENTMFHEVSHGLGCGNTIDKTKTVREALKESYTSIEESKADILGLWCVCQLYEMGEFPDKELMDNFVTFLAGIFRSVRFGAASAHGKANMIRFCYFQEAGAFERDPSTGTYRVNFDKMKEAMLNLTKLVLTIQGDGDYEKATALIAEKGIIKNELQDDLDRIAQAGIPKDIVFKQGISSLGL